MVKKSLQELLRESASLFWWVPHNKIESLPLESLVEALLNYGSMQQVRDLFNSMGKDTIAAIFREQIKRPRKVYLPQVEHYFTLYFDKYAPVGIKIDRANN